MSGAAILSELGSKLLSGSVRVLICQALLARILQ